MMYINKLNTYSLKNDIEQLILVVNQLIDENNLNDSKYYPIESRVSNIENTLNTTPLLLDAEKIKKEKSQLKKERLELKREQEKLSKEIAQFKESLDKLPSILKKAIEENSVTAFHEWLEDSK